MLLHYTFGCHRLQPLSKRSVHTLILWTKIDTLPRDTAVPLPTGTRPDWCTNDFPRGPPRLAAADAQQAGRFNKRVVTWGCQLLTDSSVTLDGASRGVYHKDGKRLAPQNRNVVEVGVAAMPATETGPAHVSILISLPIRPNTEEKYFFDVGVATQHNVEFRFLSGSFRASIRRTSHMSVDIAGTGGAFLVELTMINHRDIITIGHPWPFRGLSEDINEFFWRNV